MPDRDQENVAGHRASYQFETGTKISPNLFATVVVVAVDRPPNASRPGRTSMSQTDQYFSYHYDYTYTFECGGDV